MPWEKSRCELPVQQNGEQVMHAMEEVETQRSFGGYGADTDIMVASAKAYLSAIK